MTTKVYTCQGKRVLKDGTVKSFEYKCSKQLKNEPGSRQVRQKKPGSTYDVTYAIQHMSPENVEIVRMLVNELIAKAESEQKIDIAQKDQLQNPETNTST